MHKASRGSGRRRRLPPARARCHDAAVDEAGRRRLRGADGLRQEPDEPLGRPGAPRRRAAGRARPSSRCPTATSRRCASSGSRRSSDIDASHPTIEEREEYEEPVRHGHGHVRGRRLRGDPARRPRPRPTSSSGTAATTTSRSSRRTCCITVVDALRPGHELAYHPGETNLRMADVVVVNKIDSAEALGVEQRGRERRRPSIRGALDRSANVAGDARTTGPTSRASACSSIDDGPTLTHGGMPFGAGLVAARKAGARDDRRPAARTRSARLPGRVRAVPAARRTCCRRWATRDEQLASSSRRSTPTECDVVVTGTPIDLGAPDPTHATRSATCATSSRRSAGPTLNDVLEPIVVQAKAAHPESVMTG